MEPAWSEIESLIQGNLASVRKWPQGLRELRDMARRELDRNAPSERAWIVTGHQPVIIHPGIWFRFAMLGELASRGHCCVELVVDTDEAAPLVVRLPGGQPGPRVEEIALALARSGSTFADVALAGGVRAQCEAARSALSMFDGELVPRLEAYCVAIEGILDGERRAAIVIPAARRLMERPSDYATHAMSTIAATHSHRAFVVELAQRSVEFARAHNDAVLVYRAEHGIRNRAQPVPDLRIEGDSAELALWSVRGGARLRVWTVAGTVEDESGARIELSALAHALAAGEWVLWPRAVTLTLFQRLRVADVFIHGIGSARYDVINDDIAARLWGIRLPPTVVGTATRLVSVLPDREAEVAARSLAVLRSSPEQLASLAGPDGERLAMRKRELLTLLRERPDEASRQEL
jgi:hypothetical protein